MRTTTPYNLVNRYLQAVEKHLGAGASTDVMAELGANLAAEIEDAASEHGRDLNPEEIAAILKRHGHPMQVAGRYGRRQALIGAGLLPVYWYVLKMALGIVWLVYAVVNAVALSASGAWTAAAVEHALAHSEGVLLVTFAAVTLVFAGIEWGQARFGMKLPLNEWDPMKLPPLQKRPGQRLGWQRVGEMVPTGIMVLYWAIAVPGDPALGFAPAAMALRFTPAMERIYWPVLGLFVLSWGLDWVGLRYGQDTWQHRAKGAASKLVALAIFRLWITVGNFISAAAGFALVAHMLNTAFQFGIRIAALITVLMLIWDIAQLFWRGAQNKAAALF